MKHPLSSFVWFVQAGLVLLMPMNAKATTLAYANTVISGGSYGGEEDQDPNMQGDQLKYGWIIFNQSGQGGGINDLVWGYSVQSDLVSKGMYGFDNVDFPDGWAFSPGSTSYFEINANGVALPPGFPTTFFAYIDKSLVIGNEQAGSYGISNEGPTQTLDVTVPITRSQTSTNGTSFGWLKDHNLVADTNSSASYAAAALVDADGDCFANWQEYIADSDPNSSSSVFCITVADSALSWHSATGRVYTVKGATNLTDTFTSITSFTGVAGTLFYTNAGTDGFRFYRLEAELAP